MPQGHLHIERFTCNRCKTKVELEAGLQPEDWERVTVSSPPLGNPLEVQNYDFLLCPACVQEMLKVVQNADTKVIGAGYNLALDVGDLPLQEVADRVQTLLASMRQPLVGFEHVGTCGFVHLDYPDCGACLALASGETVKQFHDHGGANDEPDLFHYMYEGLPVCGEGGPTKSQVTSAADTVTCQTCRHLAGLGSSSVWGQAVDPLPDKDDEPERPIPDVAAEMKDVLDDAQEGLDLGYGPGEPIPLKEAVEFWAPLSEFAGKDFLLIQEHNLRVSGREVLTNDPEVLRATPQIKWDGPRMTQGMQPQTGHVAHYAVGKVMALCGVLARDVNPHIGASFTKHYELVTCKPCLKAAAVPVHGLDQAEGGFVHRADIPAEHRPKDPRPICATYEYAGHQESCRPYENCERCGSDTCPGRFYGDERCTMREELASTPVHAPWATGLPWLDETLDRILSKDGVQRGDYGRAARDIVRSILSAARNNEDLESEADVEPPPLNLPPEVEMVLAAMAESLGLDNEVIKQRARALKQAFGDRFGS